MTMAATVPTGGRPSAMTGEHKMVIFASSLGTVFEWYDFFLAITLVTEITANFFTGVDPTAGLIFALLGFAAGYIVRPFGALIFGRLGDVVGRKYTFLMTITLMGLSTFLIGFLPNFRTIGIWAPVLYISLRLLQGLALGGEYGGAATYVAEHAPAGRRGYYTSFIQTTATLGFFLALIIGLIARGAMSKEDFTAWGWRLPFLISIVLLGVSVWIRLQMQESPMFKKMVEEGKGSKRPWAESFGQWPNARIVLIALFGLTMGQAVVWYAGQFYAQIFLKTTLGVDPVTADILIVIALLIGTPFFVVFGWLSDKIGRKPIILGGCLLAAVTYFPIFKGLTYAARPALFAAEQTAPVSVVADPAECSVQFNPFGGTVLKFTKPCDMATAALIKKGIPYSKEAGPAGKAEVHVGSTVVPSYDGAAPDAKAKAKDFTEALGKALKDAKYPDKADPSVINKPLIVALLVLLVIYVTMVYGPIAAMLVELFPTRIRYTSMSLPYHIGNGWFGGLLPATAVAITAYTGDIYSGLWYPIIIALATFVIGLVLVPETKNRDIATF